MLDQQHQAKLIEAIGFFARNTKHCGLTKVFKLLYWLDYHHFRETGESVTGLTYQAFPYGPVPETLYDELTSGNGGVADQFDIELNPGPDSRVVLPSLSGPEFLDLERPLPALLLESEELFEADLDDLDFVAPSPSVRRPIVRNIPSKIKPRRPYRHVYLTKREQRIANHLAEIFRDATAAQISDVSHAKGGPWQQTLKEKGERETIDFLGRLFPVMKGDYLDEQDLRARAQEIEAETKNWV